MRYSMESSVNQLLVILTPQMVVVNLAKTIFVCAFVQGAECGEGLRRRNLSCVVHWGDWPESPPQPVEEDFCGDKLRQQIQQEMEQPCFVPCPGTVKLHSNILH